MTTQPEALRLADYCDGLADEIDHSHFTDDLRSSAAELRRLHEAHDWQYKMAGERLRRIEKLEAQRDALLTVLKELTGHINERFSGGVWDRARAAIKAVEEEK